MLKISPNIIKNASIFSLENLGVTSILLEREKEKNFTIKSHKTFYLFILNLFNISFLWNIKHPLARVLLYKYLCNETNPAFFFTG